MDALMANANPGFASRFNKKRIVFPAWSGRQASEAVVAEVERSGKSLTPEAAARVLDFCLLLEGLPMWGRFDSLICSHPFQSHPTYSNIVSV